MSNLQPDLISALQLATELEQARGKHSRVLADPRERELAAELVARISTRVATVTGGTPPEPDNDQPDTTGQPRAYTVAQAARELSLSHAGIRRLIHSGHLRSRTAGNRYLIPAQAITDYLDGATTQDAS